MMQHYYQCTALLCVHCLAVYSPVVLVCCQLAPNTANARLYCGCGACLTFTSATALELNFVGEESERQGQNENTERQFLEDRSLLAGQCLH